MYLYGILNSKYHHSIPIFCLKITLMNSQYSQTNQNACNVPYTGLRWILYINSNNYTKIWQSKVNEYLFLRLRNPSSLQILILRYFFY